jgi:hypothetical protein
MGHQTATGDAELRGKQAGSDNVCSVSFAISEVCAFAEQKRGRTPRIGLRGGHRKRHSTVDLFWSRVQKNPSDCRLLASAARRVFGQRPLQTSPTQPKQPKGNPHVFRGLFKFRGTHAETVASGPAPVKPLSLESKELGR